MARRRIIQTAGHPRRKTSWELGPEETGPLVISATGSNVWSGGIQALSQGNTLARIRGAVDVFVASATAGGDAFQGAHGICIVTADANTAGAYPDPMTEDAWDGWIWHSFFTTFVIAAADESSYQHSRMIVDNKAMRKLDETDVMVGITEVVEVNDGSTLSVFAQTRTLVLLS